MSRPKQSKQHRDDNATKQPGPGLPEDGQTDRTTGSVVREQPPEHWCQPGAEGEHQEVDRPGRTALDVIRIDFLDHRVRQHRRTRTDTQQQAEHIARCNARRQIEDGRTGREHQQRTREQHRLAAAEMVGQIAQQRTADDPAERHHACAVHRLRVANLQPVTQKRHAPDHVADCRRQEQQTRAKATQVRLRVGQHCPVRGKHLRPRTLARRACVVTGRCREKHEHRDHKKPCARQPPELLPRDEAMNDGAYGELPSRAAKHPEALREPDCSCKVARWKTMGREIHCPRKGAGGPGALHEPANPCRLDAPDTEQDRSNGDEHDSHRNHTLPAEPVKRCARDDGKQRIGVVVQADQCTDTDRIATERRGQLRDHYAWRRSQRILYEVEDDAEEPRDHEANMHGLTSSQGRRRTGRYTGHRNLPVLATRLKSLGGLLL
ncbi:hypothetical protein NECAME_17273 [Necator americanus]|uniref:Uncharacterized protein n=1 Tax=Necator americanus TaxID=51031 RepID=W2TQJ6_NECAM|nr:hypothetical protein NECAME_17273 [Necator americanus]ETN84078.1 hypothetical protein NECAME_17273 [Necator americanus]